MNKISTKALATSFNDKDYTLDCVMTAEVQDRHGEIVDIDSMDTTDFMLNPVLLQSHDYDKLAVGKVISITKTVNDQGVKVMECKLQFAVKEYEVAKTHWELYKGGYMSAFSIGFMVGKIETDTATDQVRLMNCSLLEISCVSVPANQLALAKSKGIDIDNLLKAMPEKELQKAVKELLIEVKEILLVKSDKDIANNKISDTIKSSDIGKARAKNLVERAIRELRG